MPYIMGLEGPRGVNGFWSDVWDNIVDTGGSIYDTTTSILPFKTAPPAPSPVRPPRRRVFDHQPDRPDQEAAGPPRDSRSRHAESVVGARWPDPRDLVDRYQGPGAPERARSRRPSSSAPTLTFA